jgi:DNA anti-recombination protein RmuC
MPEPAPKKKVEEDPMKRVDAVEAGLERVQGRLDSVERTTRAMQGDLKSMKEQVMSMQSSMQEMVMIFRNLQAKLQRQAEMREQAPARGGQPNVRRTSADPEAPRPGDEVVRPQRRRTDDDDF